MTKLVGPCAMCNPSILEIEVGTLTHTIEELEGVRSAICSDCAKLNKTAVPTSFLECHLEDLKPKTLAAIVANLMATGHPEKHYEVYKERLVHEVGDAEAMRLVLEV